ncbi:unnamed protein product [Candidula unifasciata]|uniref:Uncharacterized protein n=1 Tax=Candidula unifasciata TaxID=100452 RepID=A0A8S3YZB5_9EUPU|nr:unnamed protein product [Candidula unifasciata]
MALSTTSEAHQSICWREARPCPMSDASSDQKLSCQAWFHCEVAGDYVIKWKCHSLEEVEHNTTSPALSLCSNQSDAKELLDCPPPVVCADDPYLDHVHMKSSDVSTDVILAVAVSIFALLAMLLIVVSSYKYWRLRKRVSQKMMPHQYMVREFPYPVRYHNLWGSGSQFYDNPSAKNLQPTKAYGNPHHDVYFSRPQASSSYLEQLLSPADDFIDSKKEYGGSELSTPTRLFPPTGKFVADPSVATGSFVFHQPLGGAGLVGFNNKVESWVHQNKINKEKEEKSESVEYYHIYKGNIKQNIKQERQQSPKKSVDYKKEYTCLQNSSPDFSRMPQVSSIAIPSFEISGLQNTMAQHEYLNADLRMQEEVSQQFLKKRNCETGSVQETMSHYALGFVTRSGNQHFQVSHEGHNNNQHYQSVSPKFVNVGTSHPSPDVISSHNFSNKFVRVGKNVYRPLLSKSSSGSSINMHSGNNDNIDLSYDSFRNEHIRELAKRGAASSSTLEAGYRQKGHGKSTGVTCRY